MEGWFIGDCDFGVLMNYVLQHKNQSQLINLNLLLSQKASETPVDCNFTVAG
jgi:hypothetical protein